MKRAPIAFLLLLLALRLPAQTILVAPYVQPGNGSTLSGKDVKVLTWLTDRTPREFTVEFRVDAGSWTIAWPVVTPLDFAVPKAKPAPAPKPGANPLANAPTTLEEAKRDAEASTSPALPEKEQRFLRYSAELPGLPFDAAIAYRVTSGAQVIREGRFKTRASATKPVRFVAVGDMTNGKPEQKAIAWQIAQQKPDFMIALGDIVYSSGRVSQYLHHFWPTYNDVQTAGPATGAPLLASVPLYPVLGNHDLTSALPGDYPDAWAAFHFFNVPRNGPGKGSWTPVASKKTAEAAAFEKLAGAQFPSMLNYSWDCGPLHFVALDSNKQVTAEEPALLAWLEKDLSATHQPWKVVCFHAPAFHTSREHYTEQKMRLLQPLFERTRVDIVFCGHVHNYQRTKPLRFKQTEPRDKRGRITGEFQLDSTFDGVKDTTPEGVVHIVSGGGGAKLYSVDYAKTVAALKKEQGANYVPFTDKYYAEKHSFSLVEASTTAFTVRQINIDGTEVDRFTITKPAR
jgi:acid phosphatase type 7